MTTDDLDAERLRQWRDLTGHIDGVYPGTYVKVVASAGPSSLQRDSFRILYLRPNGKFLLLGYWPGYERTLAVGHWSVTDGMVQLDGFGQIQGDALPNPNSGPFQRTFRFTTSYFSPTLTADEELPGWSLLSWPGSYSYLGWEFVFDPKRGWLPESIEDVDNLIEQNLR